MKKDNIYVVILAGGRGERFWPKSRIKNPKQVVPLLSKRTLLEDSIKRLGCLVDNDNLYILCNKELKVALSRLKVLKNARIIAEPVSRNTAGAIALISRLIEKKDPDSIVVVLPCDQYIDDNRKFIRTLKTGIKAASLTDSIVTIGIKPTYPATGYGYISTAGAIKGYGGPLFKVKNFKEKPGIKMAEKYVKSKKFLWNGGIFIFRSSKMSSLFKRYAPNIYNNIKKIVNSRNFNKSLNTLYPKIEKISIDYCIMEKTRNILCVRGDFKWFDIGSWDSLQRVFRKDKNGNVVCGNFAGLSVRDSIIFSEKNHFIGAIGVSGFIIIQTKDATLICPKDRAQDVRRLVALLKKSKKTKKFL